MGYTHYWRQKKNFTKAQWEIIVAETKRIMAKATKGNYYSGAETASSIFQAEVDNNGFLTNLKENYAWRTFPHPEMPTPSNDSINLAGYDGTGIPEITDEVIAFNGAGEESYETFRLSRKIELDKWDNKKEIKKEGKFNFCKTEYRPYDAVVVSILAVIKKVAPKSVEVSSDGGDEAIKYLF